jgi:hypothetical protein
MDPWGISLKIATKEHWGRVNVESSDHEIWGYTPFKNKIHMTSYDIISCSTFQSLSVPKTVSAAVLGQRSEAPDMNQQVIDIALTLIRQGQNTAYLYNLCVQP